MNLKRVLWRASGQARSLFGDLGSEDRKVLALVVFAGFVGVAEAYWMIAIGVTDHVGPATAALVIMAAALPIKAFVVHKHFDPPPSWWRRWSAWRPAFYIGVSRAMNNLAFECVLRWVDPQIRTPLGFLVTAVFTIGPSVWVDAKERRYSTALWPLLALLGLWTLMSDSGGEGDGFTNVPIIHVLGQEVPSWALGVSAMVVISATFSLNQKKLERLDKRIKGPANTLAAIPALAIIAVPSYAMEGNWGAGGAWPYLIVAAVTGGAATALSSSMNVKAYVGGLKASSKAMLSPLNTLMGIVLGMLVGMTAPGPLGVVGVIVIIVASGGAANYQRSRKDRSSESSKPGSG